MLLFVAHVVKLITVPSLMGSLWKEVLGVAHVLVWAYRLQLNALRVS